MFFYHPVVKAAYTHKKLFSRLPPPSLKSRSDKLQSAPLLLSKIYAHTSCIRLFLFAVFCLLKRSFITEQKNKSHKQRKLTHWFSAGRTMRLITEQKKNIASTKETSDGPLYILPCMASIPL